MTAAAIVVPANNEAALIEDCLASIRTALIGHHDPIAVVVVAHRCSDDTGRLAHEHLSRLPGRAEGMVVTLGTGTVATARSIGAMAGLSLLAAYGVSFGQTWLLSTDADSRVPPDWLSLYGRHLTPGVAGVTGAIRVPGHEHDPVLARADRHGQVYAANLAVRADAYLDVGGWPDQVPGEDTGLVNRLRRHGHPVIAAPDIVVMTSARTDSRAPGGLGETLRRPAT